MPTVTTVRVPRVFNRPLLPAVNLRSPILLNPARCQPQFITSVTQDAEPVVLYEAYSSHNFVRVVEIPDHHMVDASIRELRGARILVLDNSGNIHSIWKPDTAASRTNSSSSSSSSNDNNADMTKSLWEFLATLPTLVPEGSIGILGLGAGTVARMINAHYPTRHMAGWELDPAVVMAARLYMGMDEVEATGMLTCHTGDALDPGATVEGGFAGIIVDLFLDGHVLPQLTQDDAWHCIRQRLRPGVGARVMVNLGQSPITVSADNMTIGPLEGGTMTAASSNSSLLLSDSAMTIQALDAMLRVFDGEVSVLHIRNMDGDKSADKNATRNTVALTGPFEGLQEQCQSGDNVPSWMKHLMEGYTWERYRRE